MKTGFKNKMSPKKEEPKNVPENAKKQYWDFRAPEYDQRSSCFVNAGTDYGVGHAQPVGNTSVDTGESCPMGRVETLKVDKE